MSAPRDNVTNSRRDSYRGLLYGGIPKLPPTHSLFKRTQARIPSGSELSAHASDLPRRTSEMFCSSKISSPRSPPERPS